MNTNSKVIDKVIKAHFEEPDKDLKEIFKDCTKDLSVEERNVFYKKLKEIIN